MTSKEQLESFISRIEKLSEEKKELQEDIKGVFSEAKSNGFDVKAMRQVIRLRKMRASEREEEEHLVDTYKNALGLQENKYDNRLWIQNNRRSAI